MNIKIFFAALLFTFVTSCKQTKPGFKYSEDVVAIERSLRSDIEFTESEVERFYNNGNYDSIAAVATDMEGKVQKKIDQIKKLPLPNAKGIQAFNSAVLRYFRYIKSMYTAYKNWGNADTDEERMAESGTIRNLINEKGEAIEGMQKAQQKYADANGFKVGE